MNSDTNTGWNAFRILWASQSISLLGTGMTRFAVLVWAYEQNGSATTIALLGFFSVIAYVIASPFAGVLVDRWDRRTVMFLADLGAGLMTAALLGLYAAGWLEIWHLYLAEALAGACEAFQEPAFSASVSLLVPRSSYTRANSLLGLGKSAARMLAPAIAGLLQSIFGLGVVMVADLASMILAVSALLLVRIPAPFVSAEGRIVQNIFGQELRFGIRYILQRPGLRNLMFSFFLVNLFGTLTYFAVLSPMVLARTAGDELALGTVRTLMGLGGITGGVILSLWGGAQHKTRTYLLSTLFSFLICDFLMAISRSTAGWSLAGFLAELSIPFIVSPYFALWQEHVPPDVQGRVFSTREAVQVLSQPFGYLLGGLMADHLFEPAMQGGGLLVTAASRLVGTGPGSGMSAMFLFTSLLGGLTGLLGLLSPSIRSLDAESNPDWSPALKAK